MLKAMAHALTQRPAVRGPLVPLVIALVAQIAALVLPLNAQAAGTTFAIATRYGEIVCTSQLAEDRKGLDVQCVGKQGQVVSAYRQFLDGSITVLLEEGTVGKAVTKAILDSQGKG